MGNVEVVTGLRGLGRDRVERGDQVLGVGSALLAVEVRAGFGQLAATGTVGQRGAAARPVRDVMPARVPVSMYSDRGGCFGRFCPGVSRAQCSSPLIHRFALFASPPLTPTIPNSGFDGYEPEHCG